VPGESGGLVEIAEVYGRRVAHEMIDRSRDDYRQRYAHLEELLKAATEASLARPPQSVY
jgi:uncharacterized protein YbjQ (UPF0145 family)